MTEGEDVAHQKHYESTPVQPIEYMEALATRCPAQLEGYLRFNAIKYLSRYDEKGGLEDLEKAQVYLNWLIEFKKKGVLTV